MTHVQWQEFENFYRCVNCFVTVGRFLDYPKVARSFILSCLSSNGATRHSVWRLVLFPIVILLDFINLIIMLYRFPPWFCLDSWLFTNFIFLLFISSVFVLLLRIDKLPFKLKRAGVSNVQCDGFSRSWRCSWFWCVSVLKYTDATPGERELNIWYAIREDIFLLCKGMLPGQAVFGSKVRNRQSFEENEMIFDRWLRAA